VAAGPNGLVVDAITRPHENSYTGYINLDGKFRVNDHLTVKVQGGYTQGGGNTPSNPPSRSTAATTAYR